MLPTSLAAIFVFSFVVGMGAVVSPGPVSTAIVSQSASRGWPLEFAKLLMEKALVAVSPGIGFGPLGEGYVRFALVENEHRIRQATRSIGKFLKI